MARNSVPRRIVRCFADDPMRRVEGPVNLPTDQSLANFYRTMMRAEVDAWILDKLHLLPDWWRLVSEIRAEGFSRAHNRGRDEVTWPMETAALEWAGLTIERKEYIAREWRLVKHGPDAGKAVQVDVTHRTGHLVKGTPSIDVATIQLPTPSEYAGWVSLGS